MATNKHAQIRFNILDRCFSNFGRLYSYDDLLDEVNKVLFDRGTEGIKLRQLQYDIEFMESETGWSIELNKSLKKGRKRAFRYKDNRFSIADHPLNVSDTEQLQSTLAILSRYKHREEFNWLEELIPRMEQAFSLVGQGDNGAISYQGNPDLQGLENLGILFNLIVKKKKAKLIYQPYGKETIEAIICPYHLKQFNNRWFLFGYNDQYKTLSNFPLDRIKKIEELSEAFEQSPINWIDYFDDVIGVTKPDNADSVNLKLKFSEKRINYILTKPLHGTQKIDKNDSDGLTVFIEVIPNYELYQMLLSFGDDVEVLEPKDIRDELAERISKMNEKY